MGKKQKSRKNTDPYEIKNTYESYRKATINEIYAFNEGQLLMMILTGKEYRHFKHGEYTSPITITNKKSKFNGGIPIIHHSEVFKVFDDKNAVCIYKIPVGTQCYKFDDSYYVETIDRTDIYTIEIFFTTYPDILKIALTQNTNLSSYAQKLEYY